LVSYFEKLGTFLHRKRQNFQKICACGAEIFVKTMHTLALNLKGIIKIDEKTSNFFYIPLPPKNEQISVKNQKMQKKNFRKKAKDVSVHSTDRGGGGKVYFGL